MKRSERSAKRSEVVLRMRQAFRIGRSASAFITEMRTKGLGYRRAEMLADWRSVNEIESKAGMLRNVRRDYYPSVRAMANVDWDMSQEFMYVLNIKTRRGDEEQITDKRVNIMSDIPLTPRQVEAELYERWAAYEQYAGDTLEEVTMFLAVRRVNE